jgi:hypothetical protein
MSSATGAKQRAGRNLGHHTPMHRGRLTAATTLAPTPLSQGLPCAHGDTCSAVLLPLYINMQQSCPANCKQVAAAGRTKLAGAACSGSDSQQPDAADTPGNNSAIQASHHSVTPTSKPTDMHVKTQDAATDTLLSAMCAGQAQYM